MPQHKYAMGIGIHCILEPEVPSADKFRTDGKNLAEAYISSSAGVPDFTALLDGSAPGTDADTNEEAAVPDIFSALDQFIDKEGGLSTGSFQQLHPPTAGLAAIEDTLRRLRSDEGAATIPDADLRAGCIFDLETYAKMLHEAEQHKAQFILTFDV